MCRCLPAERFLTFYLRGAYSHLICKTVFIFISGYPKAWREHYTANNLCWLIKRIKKAPQGGALE